MQLVLPDMIELGRGGIVNISSLAAFVPGPGPYEHAGGPTVLAYGGNKAAMHHLTQAVAFEVAPHGIAVNVLLPSEPVLTPGQSHRVPGRRLRQRRRLRRGHAAARARRPRGDDRSDPLERGRAAPRARHALAGCATEPRLNGPGSRSSTLQARRKARPPQSSHPTHHRPRRAPVHVNRNEIPVKIDAPRRGGAPGDRVRRRVRRGRPRR